MSQPFELPEAGRPQLERAISQLPAHEPGPATWPRIEAQLAADEALARVLPTLPAHEPDEALWQTIAGRLDEALPTTAGLAPAPPAEVRPLWPAQPKNAGRTWRRAWAMAASVALLLLGLWWQRSVVPTPRETLAFSEEEVSAPPSQPASAAFGHPDPLDQQSLAFIDAHCSALPAVCQSGEFRSLRTQLTELDAQQAQLQQDARRFGESPELRRAQARLITLRATITRELVHLLIS